MINTAPYALKKYFGNDIKNVDRKLQTLVDEKKISQSVFTTLRKQKMKYSKKKVAPAKKTDKQINADNLKKGYIGGGSQHGRVNTSGGFPTKDMAGAPIPPKPKQRAKAGTTTAALQDMPMDISAMIGQHLKKTPQVRYQDLMKRMPKNWGAGKVRDAFLYALRKNKFKTHGWGSASLSQIRHMMDKQTTTDLIDAMNEWTDANMKGKKSEKEDHRKDQLEIRDKFMKVGSYIKERNYIGIVTAHTDKGIKIKGYKLEHYTTNYDPHQTGGYTSYQTRPVKKKASVISIPFTQLRGPHIGDDATQANTESKKAYDTFIKMHDL